MNKAEQQNWRTLQLAASDIEKYLPHSVIEQTDSCYYYDLIVTLREQEIAFGVMIVRSGYATTNGFDQYLQNLRQHTNELRLPIVLMSINEAREEVKIGVLFSWQYRRPVIVSPVALRQTSPQRWNYIVDVLRATASEPYKVGVLHQDNCYIKKSIQLDVEDRNGRRFLAEIVYLRKLSLEYRMHSPVERSPEEQFQINLNGIPQNEYPSDDFDDAIYDAICSQYDVQPPQSEMLILTTELRDALHYRDYHRGSVSVSISPNIDDAFEVATQLMGQFSVFNIDIDLFAHYDEDLHFFNGIPFTHNEPVNGWMEKVMEYRRKMESYKKLSDLF